MRWNLSNSKWYPSTHTTLEPKQLRALQSLSIPTAKDPCLTPPPPHNATVCDSSSPFRLSNCSDDVYLSYTALKSLSTLQSLTFVDCPISPIRIPSSIAALENLESLNLSSNSLSGELPANFGDLISLTNVSLAGNSLSGSILDSMSAIPGLVHLDLSSNRFNGTIPKFISEMRSLKHLNLADNSCFHGVLPFNVTFLKRLDVSLFI